MSCHNHKNLKHQIFDTCRAQNLYAESFQKTSLEWCKIPPISEILWDDLVGSPTCHKISRFKISVLLHVLHCVAQKRSGGHEVMSVMFVLHLPCKIDVHVPCLPHGIYDGPHQGKPRSLQVDSINPCHAKQREHSCCRNAQSMQSRAVEPH